MSEMLDKIREMFEQEEHTTPQEQAEANTGPPLEDAVACAIYALEEIVLYGGYGRASACASTAQDALVIVKALKEKYEEENKIIEILKSPESEDD